MTTRVRWTLKTVPSLIWSLEYGLQPEISFDFKAKDKFVYYEIKDDDALIQSYIDRYTRMYGKHEVADSIEKGDERVKGFFVELDETGKIKENGIEPAESTIYLDYIKDEAIKDKMKGLKCGG